MTVNKDGDRCCKGALGIRIFGRTWRQVISELNLTKSSHPSLLLWRFCFKNYWNNMYSSIVAKLSMSSAMLENLLWLDYRSNKRLVFRVSHMKTRISPKSAKPSAFRSRMFSRPSKPAKPAVLGIWESIKHEFRICQVYRFQNWYQSNTP